MYCTAYVEPKRFSYLKQQKEDFIVYCSSQTPIRVVSFYWNVVLCVVYLVDWSENKNLHYELNEWRSVFQWVHLWWTVSTKTCVAVLYNISLPGFDHSCNKSCLTVTVYLFIVDTTTLPSSLVWLFCIFSDICHQTSPQENADCSCLSVLLK